MRKSISLGKDQGHRARVRGIEITDEQFNPFLVQLIISGDKSLGIYQATFTTDQGSFHTELPRERRPRVRLRLNNAPNSPSSTFSAEHREEHTFNISNDDAVAIMNSNTLAVTFTGRMQQRSYTFKQKHLAEFKKWLGPLVKKYVPGEDPK